MPIPIWTVCEIQDLGNDQRAGLAVCYTDEDEAIAGYFQTCAAAARSGLAHHAVILIPPNVPIDRRITRWEVFERSEF